MNKLIAIIAAASMLATPVVAEAHGRRDDGHRHRGVSTEGAVAIGLGALILGAAISNSNRNARTVERYEHREYREYRRQSQYVCEDVVKYDYYGNPYVAGRNCWYQ